MKAYREAEKEEMLETEMNHNFEADMYLEKLEHENEKVNQIRLEHLQTQILALFICWCRKSRDRTATTYWVHIFDHGVRPNSSIRTKC